MPESAKSQAVDPNLVAVSGDELRQALASPFATAEAKAGLAQELQLSPQQVAALAGGGGGLQMTRMQYANLVATLATLRASASSAKGAKGAKGESGGIEGDDGCCGSSATPSPAPSGPSVPSVTTTKNSITEHDDGTTHATDRVGNGTVTLRSDILSTGPAGRKTRFAIGYQGNDSQDNHWLQFIHREILGIFADGRVVAQTGNVTTTGGNYRLTTGGTATANGTPATDNYNTDTKTADPFYESGFTANRTADSTTMFDAPAAIDARVQAAFAAGAERVISRAHFDTFLVTKDHVTYKANTHVVWSFASADAAAAPVTTMAGGAANALPAPIAERFHEQFPAYNFIT